VLAGWTRMRWWYPSRRFVGIAAHNPTLARILPLSAHEMSPAITPRPYFPAYSTFLTASRTRRLIPAFDAAEP
jgi:hypothetical protein